MAHCTKSAMVRSTWPDVSSLGVNHPMGALMALGATLNGWYPYRPECKI